MRGVGMETTLQRLQAVTVQDVVLATVCVLSVYLLRVHQTLLLTPAWKKHVPLELYHNGKYPGKDELLPHPLITDLDSDGLNEIVMITNGLHLEVLGYQTAASGSLLPDLVVRSYVRLPIIRQFKEKVNRPIAMAAGYLRKSTSGERLNQVIVVAFDNWEVLCYDDELRLLWRKQPMDVSDLRKDHVIKSFTVFIVPQSLRSGDNGTVIVGGNFDHMERNDMKPQDAHKAAYPKSKHGQQLDRFTHFSTFALEGSTGDTRWQHLPESLKSILEMKKYHHWKLAIHGGDVHPGEVHWSKFGTNMLKLMPHSWNSLADTQIQLTQLHKLDPLTPHERGGESVTILSDIFGIDSHRLSDWVRPGDKQEEDTAKPNAVVIHYNRGLEVLHLHNGMSATRVRLEAGHAAYADIDMDGTLDMVEMEFTHDKCLAFVSSLYPHQRALFVEPLCEEATWWGSVSFMSPPPLADDVALEVTPVIVKRIAQSSGILGHLVGKTLSSERVGCDSVFVTRNGYVTSYGPAGEFNWQSTVQAEWTTVLSRPTYTFMTNDMGDVYSNAFEPSLIPFSPETRSTQQSAVLVTGWDYMAVVDLRDGYVLAGHSLPCHPLTKPVLGDFNGDGWTDILIVCPQEYVGFTIHRHGNYVYTTLVAVTVILTILLLNWCCQPDKHPFDDTDD